MAPVLRPGGEFAGETWVHEFVAYWYTHKSLKYVPLGMSTPPKSTTALFALS